MSARVRHGRVAYRSLRRDFAALLCATCTLAGLPLRAHADGAIAPDATAVVVASTDAGLAQGLGFSIDNYTIDNGGGTASGGVFSLNGTIGQPDADPLQPSTGGVFAVTGGFWAGATAAAPTEAIFANGFE